MGRKRGIFLLLVAMSFLFFFFILPFFGRTYTEPAGICRGKIYFTTFWACFSFSYNNSILLVFFPSSFSSFLPQLLNFHALSFLSATEKLFFRLFFFFSSFLNLFFSQDIRIFRRFWLLLRYLSLCHNNSREKKASHHLQVLRRK